MRPVVQPPLVKLRAVQMPGAVPELALPPLEPAAQWFLEAQ